MTIPLPRTLTLRLAFFCIAIALIATLLIGAGSYQVRHQQLQQLQDEALSHLLDSTLPVLRQLLHNQQPELTQGLIAGLTQHPAIASVVLLDETGTLLQQADRLQRHRCNEGFTATLWSADPGLSIYPLQQDNHTLGKLILQPDRCYLLNALHNTVARQLGYALLSTLLICSSLGLLIFFFFIRPLHRLLQRATAKTPLPAMTTDSGNELEYLQQLLTHLQHELQNQQQQQSQAESTILDYSRKLEALVSKRTDALTLLNRRLHESRLHTSQPALQLRLNQLMQLLQGPLQQLTECLDQHQPEAARALTAQIRQLTTDLNTLQESGCVQTSESINLCELSENLLQQCDAGNSAISLICDLHEDILLSRPCLSLLLQGLFSNALLHRGHSSLVLHLQPLQQQLQISLSGKQLHIPAAGMQRELLPLDPANAQLPSLLGLGLLQELVTLLDGELRLEPYELQGQSLVCILPLRRRSHLQSTLQGYFSKHPVSLRLSDDQQRQRIQQWLQNWQIPFTTQPPESHQILLTDLHRQEHQSELTLSLHSDDEWSESRLMLALETLMRQQPGAGSHDLNILVVDDNSINRLLCERYLRNLNVQPDLAENGLQAVELGHRQRYDLILMDCRMPVMDGLDATRQLRTTSQNRDTPIIALTGLSGDDERQNCLAAGMNDFISKPFNQEQIQAVLMQWVPEYDAPASD